MKVLKHQQWHILSLLVLLAMLFVFIESDSEILKGSFVGMSTQTWFILALLSPIIHQFYVLICWRLELYNKSITKTFGKKGFLFYKVGFAILILSRIITIIPLAISSANTLDINPVFSFVFSAVLFIPAAYLGYSVAKFFGIDRAFGIDHFKPEEAKNIPFVKKGIFKYTSNGMYIYGFFILWIPGVYWQSEAALSIALFNHIYIWVHYYFTELPDIKEIYK